jgi:hypothetical protein
LIFSSSAAIAWSSVSMCASGCASITPGVLTADAALERLA